MGQFEKISRRVRRGRGEYSLTLSELNPAFGGMKLTPCPIMQWGNGHLIIGYLAAI
jgi:hypothetical protein